VNPPVPPGSRREAMQGVVAPLAGGMAASPAVKELDVLATKADLLTTKIKTLAATMKTVGLDQRNLDQLVTLQTQLDQVNAKIAEQITLVNELNSTQQASEARIRLDALRVEQADLETRRLDAQLDQARKLAKELDTIRTDTARRVQLFPEQREFFARDAVAESKKFFDNLTMIVARLREQMSVMPTITQAQREQLRDLEGAVIRGREFRTEQQETIQGYADIEAAVRRIMQIRERADKMTRTQEQFEDEAALRRAEELAMIKQAQEEFGRDPMAVRGMLQTWQDLAQAQLEAAEAGRVALDVSDKQKKLFTDLDAVLRAQTRTLKGSTQSWLEYEVAAGQFTEEQQETLNARLRENQALQDFAEQRQRDIERDQAYTAIMEQMREELERLTLSERDLMAARLARTRIGPLGEEAGMQLFDALQDERVTKRRFEAGIVEREQVNDIIRSLQERNRVQVMTNAEIATYEAAIRGADAEQRKLIESSLDLSKVQDAAAEISNTLIGTFEDLLFRADLSFRQIAESFARMAFRIALQSAEVDKGLTKLFAQGLELGLKLLGGASAASSAANVTTTTANTATSAIEGGGGLDFGSVIQRQTGGPVMPGRFYMVGERGPELFTTGTPGTIVPNSGMARGPAVVVNITTPNADSFLRSRGEIENVMMLSIQRASRNA
jgi:hypothetical protein